MSSLFGKEICFVTTNSVVYRKELVMGGGIALVAKQFNPYLARYFGMKASRSRMDGGNGIYGLIEPSAKSLVGAFQTKVHFSDPSRLDVIELAVDMLHDYVERKKHYVPDFTVNLNFPGIGLGGLSVKDVEPLLTSLPDNVFVWRFEEK